MVKRSISKAGASDSQGPLNKNAKIQSAVKYRQYKDSYALMGFTCTDSNPQAECFFCGVTLSNNSMKPSHLQRHLTTKHACHVGKPSSFSKKIFGISILARCDSKSYNNFKESTQASYVVSLLVAKAKKPFTIVEKLLLPAAKVLAETMLDKTAADKFNAVPLSNDTVSRRVDVMATDIVDQVVAKLTGSFVLQLDESTDVSGSAQLVGFVRYLDADDIADYILFCKSMQGRTTGKIFLTS